MVKKAERAHSPYVRYQKQPHQYSAPYHAWRRARLAGREKEAHYAAIEHAKLFAYWLPKPEDRNASPRDRRSMDTRANPSP